VLINKLDWELVKVDKEIYSTAAKGLISIRALDSHVALYITQSNIHIVDST
jgi:hypothetical protein